MGDHRNPSPATALLARVLEDTYVVYATTPTRYDGPSRVAGVSHLTGVVLEQRVALEACR
jgi:hypothetical protein